MSGNLIRYSRLHCKPAMMVSNPEEKQSTVRWREIIHVQQNTPSIYIFEVTDLRQRCLWQYEWSESWTALTCHYFPFCPYKVRSGSLLYRGCSSAATRKAEKSRTEMKNIILINLSECHHCHHRKMKLYLPTTDWLTIKQTGFKNQRNFFFFQGQ